MKYLRILLFTLTVLMALSATLLSSSAQAITQVDPAGLIPPPTDPEMLDPDKPPLLGGAPYPFPIIIDEGAAPVSPEAPAAPAITVWYGLNQRAGHRGDPQKWFNVVGNVASAAPLAGLAYTLNGGPARPLSVGPDNMRLARPGDFNIELDYTDLRPGPNAVAITATDTAGSATTVTVTVPPLGVNLSALEIRFRAICFIARRSALTSSGSLGIRLRRLTPARSAWPRIRRMTAEMASRASNSSR